MKTITNGHGERIIFSATYRGEQIPDDQIIFENDTFTFIGEDLVIDFAQYSFCNFIIKGKNCVIYSGHSCTFNVGDYTVIKCGSWSKFIVGDCCTVCCGADCIFYSARKKSTIVGSWYPGFEDHYHIYNIPQKKTVKLNCDGSLVHVTENAMFTDIVSTRKR